jgi:hypothetical protein
MARAWSFSATLASAIARPALIAAAKSVKS